MDNIQTFIDALKQEIGYKETGYNHNKFAQYIADNYPQFYNSPSKQNQPWCCIFIHTVMMQTFGYDETKLLTNLPDHNSGAGCEGCANAYRQGGQRIKGKENLQIGDQVIFGAYSYDHTGVIYDIIDGKKGIYLTIEGNYMDAVRVVKRNYNEMIFVGRPRWELLP